MSVRHFGLDDMFDALEPGSPQGVVKAAAIQRLLERWQLKPAAAVYVGDGAADMLAAHEVGVLAAGAAWAQGARTSDLHAARAHVIFTDAAVFLGWLDAQTRSIPTS
jgi:phosphoglycolate phosphatase-like HAD superfamily hydrolase